MPPATYEIKIVVLKIVHEGPFDTKYIAYSALYASYFHQNSDDAIKNVRLILEREITLNDIDRENGFTVDEIAENAIEMEGMNANYNATIEIHSQQTVTIYR